MSRIGIHDLLNGASLPPYGTYVLVFGVDEQMHGKHAWHVCEMNDLGNGHNFETTGYFWWLTENGTRITDVRFWTQLPPIPE